MSGEEQDEGDRDRPHGLNQNQWNRQVWFGLDWIGLNWIGVLDYRGLFGE